MKWTCSSELCGWTVIYGSSHLVQVALFSGATVMRVIHLVSLYHFNKIEETRV